MNRPLFAMATALALACAGLSAYWLAHTIIATEHDTPLRAARIAGALLIVAIEVAAMAFAASLPHTARPTKTALVILALACAGLDMAHITLGQLTQHTAATTATSTASVQIQHIQDTIARKAATIDRLHASAAAQADSKFPQSRADGAASLRQAIALETDLTADRQALAVAMAAAQNAPQSLTTIAGQTLTLGLSIALSFVITAAGLIFAHLAGHLAPITITRPEPTTARPELVEGQPISPARPEPVEGPPNQKQKKGKTGKVIPLRTRRLKNPRESPEQPSLFTPEQPQLFAA
jgi:hypothetical protein